MKLKFSNNLNELKESKAFKKSGKLKREFYEKEILSLHHEMVKLQAWAIKNSKRILVIFEGFDTAGKSSSIKALSSYLNPRNTRLVALPKPSDIEREQWYFQRHIRQLPDAKEIVFFDRSWYNRAGIEPIFDFCTQEEYSLFMRQVQPFERMICDDGIMLFKFYLTIDKKTQKNRIKDRESNPLKSWKLSELDYKSAKAYDRYVKLRDKMFELTGTKIAPWVEFDANDKKRARLNMLRVLLGAIDYDGKDENTIMGVDKEIVTLHNKGEM